MAKAKQQTDENVPNFALDLSQMKVLTDAPRKEAVEEIDEAGGAETPSRIVHLAGAVAQSPPSCMRPLLPSDIIDSNGAPLSDDELDKARESIAASGTPPVQVDLEEAGFTAMLAQERVTSKALAFENARLTAELSRVRCESAVIVAGSELQRAQATYTAAKKSAEDKLGISLDDYNYEPVGAVLRRKTQS